MDSLVFVTSNPGKAQEASRLLGRPITAMQIEIPEIQAVEFGEVVAQKAVDAARWLGKPVLVEDSGLEIAAWSNFPGALTKWVTKSVGEAGLVRMLTPFGNRQAVAVSVLGVAWPGIPPEAVPVVEGRVPGTIAPAPRGTNGFGWDVIFIPDGDTRTFAEMPPADKDARSHRGRAFAALKKALETLETL